MRRKKLLTGLMGCCLVLVMLTASLVAWTPEATAADKVYRWRMQTLQALKMEGAYDQLFENLNAATGGRVQIQWFPSGAIVPSDQMAQAVSKGTLECAFTYGGYHSGYIDIANLECGVPMAWSNVEGAMKFHYVFGFENLAREAYAEKGIYWVTPIMEEPFLLISKTPVRSIEDMKKLKVRCTSTVATVLKPFGISTIYLPSEEFYTSLATGVIDAIIYGSEASYTALKLQEVAKYITNIKILNPMTSAFIVNQKVWDSLPPDLQVIVRELARANFNIDHYRVRTQMANEVKDVFEYQPFPAEDVARLTEAAQEVWEKEAAKSPRAAKGVEMLKKLAREEGRL